MSLHWILALTVTTLHCFTAHTNPVTRSYTVLYNEFENGVINDLLEYDCMEDDSMFYSPSGTGNCLFEAIDCSNMELEKVKTECFEDKDKINKVKDAKNYIQEMMEAKNITLQADPNNCFCGEEELLKPYKEFINNILRLFQKLNSHPKQA